MLEVIYVADRETGQIIDVKFCREQRIVEWHDMTLEEKQQVAEAYANIYAQAPVDKYIKVGWEW